MSLAGRLRAGLRRTAEHLTARLAAITGAERRAGAAPDSRTTLAALEELLIEADVGVAATERIVAGVREAAEPGADPRELVRREMLDILDRPSIAAAPVAAPRVVLVVGVNGTGKTTTVGKLAHRWRLDGEKPLICAADTFRAAAVPQLDAWAGRAQVDMIKAGARADPAAVVFDSVQAGRARGCSVVIVDTAGRLHTRADLMAELGKIRRVAGRAAEGAPHEVLLVLDATVGQNGLVQARQFLDTAGVTGVVLTKLDGTAKGGVAVAIAGELEVPIRFVGVGEGLEDLLPFSAVDYVEALFGAGDRGDGRS
ncbi:MAG: signal recognition particle-docking protein FtsY [Acidobacteria bacterium]|nr:signal recognition particle-docking protein FtsY [Acidobacteriota bacterium]